MSIHSLDLIVLNTLTLPIIQLLPIAELCSHHNPVKATIIFSAQSCPPLVTVLQQVLNFRQDG